MVYLKIQQKKIRFFFMYSYLLFLFSFLISLSFFSFYDPISFFVFFFSFYVFISFRTYFLIYVVLCFVFSFTILMDRSSFFFLEYLPFLFFFFFFFLFPCSKSLSNVCFCPSVQSAHVQEVTAAKQLKKISIWCPTQSFTFSSFRSMLFCVASSLMIDILLRKKCR